ncbi:MAG: flagellar biosynthesis protein FlgL, partial [Spirochaetia bacterium]|nr:flagellar biosynthesis protein FlgL [Spirochaetia bacterium]
RELPDGRLVFAIESSYPHRIQMEDIKGGTVMQDLGVIREGKEGQFVGNNIHPNTLESGGSIFDIVIRFRNSLLKNQQEDIGSRDLRDLSAGIDNMLLNQARLSANANRLEMTEKKLARDQELTTERLSKNEDIDVAQASIRYSEMENIHRISLMTASKLIQPTLLDYLR